MAKYIVVHSVRVCTEFTPETFGRLTTIGTAFQLPIGAQGKHKARQVCVCTCGIAGLYLVANLHNGTTKSCGCLNKEVATRLNTTHGMRHTSEYVAWLRMRDRCDNPKLRSHKTHGARGITYCERWKKFENFFADMGLKPSPSHTLDRFPGQNGNYEKSNCRWATQREQQNNRTNNLLIVIGGNTDTLANWCRFYGICYKTAHSRVRAGMDPILALTKPSRKHINEKKTSL